MRWYRKLYVGSGAEPHMSRIRQKAAEGSIMPGIYYVTLSTGKGQLLELFHNGFLSEALFAKYQCQDIVGVAFGRQEAFRLTAQIIEEVYQKTGGFDMHGYFREEEFQSEEGIRNRCCR